MTTSVARGISDHPEGLPYSMLEEGALVGRCHFQVDRGEIDALVDILDDDEYTNAWPETTDAPAAWGFLCVTKAMKELAVVPPGCIFAGIRIEFLRPFVIGSQVDVEVTVDRLYEKRGRPYVDLRYIARDEHGQTLMRLDHIIIWGR